VPHRLRSVALSLALLLAAFALELGPRATAAGAAPVADRLFSFGVGAGPTLPSGDASNAFNNGYNAFGFLRLNLPAFPIDPRVSLTYQKLDLEDASYGGDELAAGGTYGGGELETTSLVLEGQIAILPLGPVQTYGIVGAGWSDFKVTLDGGATGGSVNDNTTALTYTAGLGVSVGLGALRCFAEGRLSRIENDGELIALDSVDLVPVTFGIRF
jgi:opacity protein-like surface antigen